MCFNLFYFEWQTATLLFILERMGTSTSETFGKTVKFFSGIQNAWIAKTYSAVWSMKRVEINHQIDQGVKCSSGKKELRNFTDCPNWDWQNIKRHIQSTNLDTRIWCQYKTHCLKPRSTALHNHLHSNNVVDT